MIKREEVPPKQRDFKITEGGNQGDPITDQDKEFVAPVCREH
jgi:hypothetical protein